MKKIQNIGLILLSILTISGSAFLIGQSSSRSNDVSVNMANNSNKALSLAVAKQKTGNKNNPPISTASSGDDMVIVNVSNFGRSNPFKPFEEKSLIMNNTPVLSTPTINVPKPPEFNPDPNFSTLMGIKVSGILYDSRRPSAIINVDKADYLVHKGDFLFNFYVKDITYDKVAIRYGNNVYRAGIGEIIEGIVNINPVNNRYVRASNSASSITSSQSPNIKLSNPVNLPTLPTLR